MSPRRERASNKKRNDGPRTWDRHKLYEIAVQSPDFNADFFDRVYRRLNGTKPRLLKEDFCGTALLSAEWVRKHKKNEAIGVDLDRETLRWGKKHNIAPLGQDASRVTLLRTDVRDVTRPKVDVVAALNFSYFVFKTPKELRGYFKKAKSSLRKGGIFVLDMFGGWEAHMNLVDRTRNKGFTYLWEQRGLNPITSEVTFHIHFQFHGGGSMQKAFTCDWRLWSIPEVRECLQDVGFEKVDVYWEGTDDDGDGNGVFRRVTKVENQPGWHTFIVAY